ncbi:MAG TPA: hypothetical protein VMF66_18785, partial [Candidatus Acidoferrum sp.]|nr:hypothetical protein [Candidatus Acidoferrum sp.]
MRQTIHIFKKDVRHLWPEIAIVLLTNVAFVLDMVRQARAGTDAGAAQGTVSTLITYLLPFAWIVLVARAVYGETLVGTRQFWITRPYSWRSLLAAKALFVVATVNLPKLIADAIVLRVFGFSLLPQATGLLWAQLLIDAWLVLPVAALAAVTTGVVQLIAAVSLAGLALVTLGFVLNDSSAAVPWFALEWTRSYAMLLVIAAAAIAIVVRQYRRQGTLASRAIAVVSLVVALTGVGLLRWPAAFALQSWLSHREIDPSTVRAGLDVGSRWTTTAEVARDGSVELDVPLRVSGIPTSLVAQPQGITATIEGPRGDTWRCTKDPPAYVKSTGTHSSFHARLSRAFYEKVKNDAVGIRGSLYLTLYGNARQTTLRLEDQPRFVVTPGVGLCSALRRGSRILLNCRSALKSRADEVVFDVVHPHIGAPSMSFNAITYPRLASFSPFPADDPLIAENPVIPVEQTTFYATLFDDVTGVTAYAIEPVAYVRADFEITSLRLADFEARPAAPERPFCSFLPISRTMFAKRSPSRPATAWVPNCRNWFALLAAIGGEFGSSSARMSAGCRSLSVAPPELMRYIKCGS